MSLIPAFMFGMVFVSIGALLIYFAFKGETFAEQLTAGGQMCLGSAGMAFGSAGLCTITCVITGGSFWGKRVGAFLMAAGIGLLGIAFISLAILDPGSIRSSINGFHLGAVSPNVHFGLGAVAFILGGIFLLSQTPKIYRNTMKQIDQAIR